MITASLRPAGTVGNGCARRMVLRTAFTVLRPGGHVWRVSRTDAGEIASYRLAVSPHEPVYLAIEVPEFRNRSNCLNFGHAESIRHQRSPAAWDFCAIDDELLLLARGRFGAPHAISCEIPMEGKSLMK